MIWTDNTCRVALFGHRHFDGHLMLDEKLFPILKNLICSEGFVEIYIGRDGEFDIYAATVIKRAQKAFGKENNELICVLPYNKRDIKYLEEYYDSVIIPECVSKSHPKSAITRRNKWMVEQAELVICYVTSDTGGAYTAIKYAEVLKKRIINLAE